MALSPWEVVLLFAPSAYEWCKFLDSSSGPQPNETWQDCPHHSGVQSCTLRGSWLLSKIWLSLVKYWAQHHSHFLNPHSPRGQHRFRDWLDSSLLQTDATTKPDFRTPPGPLSHFHTASARQYWSLSHSSSESWHRFRSLIPCKGRRSLRLTLFILANNR